MNKILTRLVYILVLTFVPKLAFSQMDSLVNKAKKLKDPKKYYIYKQERISHRYPCREVYCENVRIAIENKKFVYYELNDSNQVLRRIEAKAGLDSSFIISVGDSISKSVVNKSVYGNDSVYPSTILIYDINLIYHGVYEQFGSSGNLIVKGYSRNGYAARRWKYFNSDGDLIRIVRYNGSVDNVPIRSKFKKK